MADPRFHFLRTERDTNTDPKAVCLNWFSETDDVVELTLEAGAPDTRPDLRRILVKPRACVFLPHEYYSARSAHGGPIKFTKLYGPKMLITPQMMGFNLPVKGVL